MATDTMKKDHRPMISLVMGEDRSAQSPEQLREWAEKEPAEFANITGRAIQDGSLSWKTLAENGVELGALLRTLMGVDVIGVFDCGPTLGMRALTTAAFPLLTGNLTIQAFNAAYDDVEGIADQLVTDFDSNKKQAVIARLSVDDTKQDHVPEGEDFPLVGASEDWVIIGELRNGYRLAITQETIDEVGTSGFLDRVNQVARLASNKVEKQTLNRITDATGSNTSSSAAPHVYKPKGVAAALYSSSANTPNSRVPNGSRIDNNAFVDGSNLETARSRFASAQDDNGERLAIWRNDGSMILLMPDALVSSAAGVLDSIMIPGIENQNNPWGPRGRYRVTLLSSPRLDDISTTAWYLGRFKEQFKRKWKIRMELVTLALDEQTYLLNRTAFQTRIAWDVETGADDVVFVLQNLDGTTYTP